MSAPNDAPVRLTEDPDVIYLEPGEGDPYTGRMWCEDDVWSGDEAYEDASTKYIRADVADCALAEARELIEGRMDDHWNAIDWEPCSCGWCSRARVWLAVTAQETDDGE